MFAVILRSAQHRRRIARPGTIFYRTDIRRTVITRIAAEIIGNIR